jgi:hypothetical protein
MNFETPPNQPPGLPRAKLNWPVLLAQLFIPTVATIAAVQMNKGEAAAFIAFFGGIGSGLTAGVMLGLHIGRTAGVRVALSLGFVVILGVACIAMNCFGCLASGYKLNL